MFVCIKFDFSPMDSKYRMRFETLSSIAIMQEDVGQHQRQELQNLRKEPSALVPCEGTLKTILYASIYRGEEETNIELSRVELRPYWADPVGPQSNTNIFKLSLHSSFF